MDRKTFNTLWRSMNGKWRIETRLRVFVFRDDAGKYLTKRNETGHAIKPARMANLLAYMADARSRENWHDFLTYRERLRALREGRREREIPYFTGRGRAA